MAEQTETQNPEQSPEEEIAGVLALLLIGAGLVATARSLSSFLKIPFAAVLPVMSIMRKTGTKAIPQATTKNSLNVPTVAVKKTPTQIVTDANNHYRSAFLINSSRRVAQAADPDAQLARESQFWQAHVQASNRRMYAAKETEEAEKEHGKLLGWYATLDARTTDDCRAANGRNFLSTDPPVTGLPGAVHLRCRCKAGPPHLGGKMVDDSTTVRISKDASGFEKREGNGQA